MRLLASPASAARRDAHGLNALDITARIALAPSLALTLALALALTLTLTLARCGVASGGPARSARRSRPISGALRSTTWCAACTHAHVHVVYHACACVHVHR